MGTKDSTLMFHSISALKEQAMTYTIWYPEITLLLPSGESAQVSQHSLLAKPALRKAQPLRTETPRLLL